MNATAWCADFLCKLLVVVVHGLWVKMLTKVICENMEEM